MSTASTLPKPNLVLAIRSSETVSAEITALNNARCEAEDLIRALANQYDAAILAGDDQAQANEAATATARRSVRRAELRLVELEDELISATNTEQEAVAEQKRQVATAAVSAVLAKLDKCYLQPARTIAAFAAEYDAANDLASDAGVPTAHDAMRVIKGYTEPSRTEQVQVYIDESGCETNSPRPPGTYYQDEQGRQCVVGGNSKLTPVPERPRRTKPVTIEARRVTDQSIGSLTGLLNLPGARIGDDVIWRGLHVADALEQARKR